MNDKVEEWLDDYLCTSTSQRYGVITSTQNSYDVTEIKFIPFSMAEVILYISTLPVEVSCHFLLKYKNTKIYINIEKMKDATNVTLNINNHSNCFINTNKYNTSILLKKYLSRKLNTIVIGDLTISYKAFGKLFDEHEIVRNNEKIIEQHRQYLNKLTTIFGEEYNFEMKIWKFSSLPLFVHNTGQRKKFRIKWVCKSDKVTTTEIAKIISDMDTYKKQIRNIVNTNLIFYSYVGIVNEIKLKFEYRKFFVVEMIFMVELFTNKDFYRTIGYYRGELKHIHEVYQGEQQKDKLLYLATKLEIDIAGVENIYEFLLNHIATLQYKHFC